jgi:DNA-binding NtrC family response regulator
MNRKKRKILVVDDRINTLKVMMAILEDEGYTILTATRGAKALEIFEEYPNIDLVLSDLKLPEMDGVELYRKMSQIRKVPPFIIMTAYGTVKSAVQAMKEGISNYLIKPINYEELAIVLERAILENERSEELLNLQEQVRNDHSFHSIIGSCPEMTEIFDLIRTVGPTDVPVLILGETGTGKELLARALHLESTRRDQGMICINSAALTESLLEAELFGYVKGAFTGAVNDKKGRLEIADQGTLFLDEIGQMSMVLQAKLLRFLENMTFEPIGSTETRKVDVRLIAATNLDLNEEIRKGRFLKDLLYRIEVISIRLPPLHQRQQDIPLLVHSVIKQYAAQFKKDVEGVQPDLMEVLCRYPWPGNVRELKNSLARAIILSKGPLLTLENFPEKVVSGLEEPTSIRPKKILAPISENGVRLRDLEVELIKETLKKCDGNKSIAARQLGISRKTLYEKMARFGILLEYPPK